MCDEDDDVAMFEFAFLKPEWRRGKLRLGGVGSRRRGGEHRCMGRCGLCCDREDKFASRSHLRKRQEGWIKTMPVLDVDPRGAFVQRFQRP